MKEITKSEMQLLIDMNIVRNSRRGYVNKKGFPVSYYCTRNKRYIEDKYADIARSAAK